MDPPSRCDSATLPLGTGDGARRRFAIVARFEQFLAANHDRVLYLAEICAAVGTSERTLRNCCHEHLGMGPIRYLWLRRMQLARHALLEADRTDATVTAIATEYGFWELGRFAAEYRTLFGESPSATLRHLPDDQYTPSNFALPFGASEAT